MNIADYYIPHYRYNNKTNEWDLITYKLKSSAAKNIIYKPLIHKYSERQTYIKNIHNCSWD